MGSSVLPAILKAATDSFTYACGLRDGRVVVFAAVTLLDSHGVEIEMQPFEYPPPSDVAFVRLEEVQSVVPYVLRQLDDMIATFDRGLDVRVEDIVWAADAPFGS